MNVLWTYRLRQRCIVDVMADSVNLPNCRLCLCTTEYLDFHDTELLRLKRLHHLSNIEMVFAVGRWRSHDLQHC